MSDLLDLVGYEFWDTCSISYIISEACDKGVFEVCLHALFVDVLFGRVSACLWWGWTSPVAELLLLSHSTVILGANVGAVISRLKRGHCRQQPGLIVDSMWRAC